MNHVECRVVNNQSVKSYGQRRMRLGGGHGACVCVWGGGGRAGGRASSIASRMEISMNRSPRRRRARPARAPRLSPQPPITEYMNTILDYSANDSSFRKGSTRRRRDSPPPPACTLPHSCRTTHLSILYIYLIKAVFGTSPKSSPTRGIRAQKTVE